MVKYYLDADSSRHALARAIRAHSIDVQTALEVGLRTALDDRHIAHVLATHRVMITGDHRLAAALVARTATGDHHPGILFLHAKDRKQVGAILFSVRLVHAVYSAEEMVDRIEYIPF